MLHMLGNHEDDPELADKPLIIRKRDGGFNYASADVGTIDYRVNELKADAIWYRQILHFKQIFAVARREDYTVDLRHITLAASRGRSQTDAGENVPLRELVDEASGRTRKSSSDLTGRKRTTSPRFGIGAVNLPTSRHIGRQITFFQWEKMLSLHGNTAPSICRMLLPARFDLSQSRCSHALSGR